MILGAKWAVDLWLAPILAAIAAVVLTRLTAGVERRAWARDVRRDVYARFLIAATKVWHTRIEIDKRKERAAAANEVTDVSEPSGRLLTELTELSAAVAELRLYASDELMGEALRAHRTLISTVAAALPDHEHWLSSVVRLMRADLDVPVRRSGRARVRHRGTR
jgi:hypothetical protein